MGCAASKGAAMGSPGYEASSASAYEVVMSGSASAAAAVPSAEMASIWSRPVRLESFDLGGRRGDCRREEEEAGGGRRMAARGNNNNNARLGNQHRYIEAEQVAAGWPAWLSSVAAEAVQGWVPLKAENFEKLEKIGQGTYSSVFRARRLETGKVVALKKVRFDSVEPESVRFMAREILILRRLQGHPNVVGLEGLITSRSSPNIYLVFEYMEHDLAGLVSSPDISFSQPQIKCYMRQLLAGLEHCHARGVMHRDIKCANLLVSNSGELKVADFGLANLFAPSSSPPQPLTSRVVTLWYRPPELLLGATAYEPSVDLWSAGCVFAELHARRPVLQGRTEVEQIHKIFKLCGSPPDAYWRRAGMSHAAVFRPQQPHESRLGEAFGAAMPGAAFRLLEALLSVEPAARGTASDALASEYFATEPYACEPSSLPKYAPNKEMDAKLREDSRRRSSNNGRGAGAGEAAPVKRLSRAHRSMQDTTSAIASQRHHHHHHHGHGHGHVHAEDRPRRRRRRRRGVGEEGRRDGAEAARRPAAARAGDRQQPPRRRCRPAAVRRQAGVPELPGRRRRPPPALRPGAARRVHRLCVGQEAPTRRDGHDQEKLLQGTKNHHRRRQRHDGYSIRGGEAEAGDDEAVGAGRRGLQLLRSLQQQVHQGSIRCQAAQEQQEVQGEGGEGGFLGAVAVAATAHRRAPAEPRAADPASRTPVVVPQRKQEGAALRQACHDHAHSAEEHHMLF